VVIGVGFPWTYFPTMCTKQVSLCVCLYVGLCVHVCSLTTREWEERLSPNFRDGFRCKNGQRPENWYFPFVMGPADKVPLQTHWALGTGHTGTDAIDADGTACILHMGMGRQRAVRGCLHNARLGWQNG